MRYVQVRIPEDLFDKYTATCERLNITKQELLSSHMELMVEVVDMSIDELESLVSDKLDYVRSMKEERNNSGRSCFKCKMIEFFRRLFR